MLILVWCKNGVNRGVMKVIMKVIKGVEAVALEHIQRFRICKEAVNRRYSGPQSPFKGFLSTSYSIPHTSQGSVLLGTDTLDNHHSLQPQKYSLYNPYDHSTAFHTFILLFLNNPYTILHKDVHPCMLCILPAPSYQ